MLDKGELSPILKSRSPLVLYKTYEKGLLPTPKIRPLRKVIWVKHPVIELQQACRLAKSSRNFSLLEESVACDYTPGIFMRSLVGVYGEKIARISHDSDESCKQNMQDSYSPRTKSIYSMLEGYIFSALQEIHLSNTENNRRRFSKKKSKKPSDASDTQLERRAGST